jgi:puromycin-sensitive aminopeptidase
VRLVGGIGEAPEVLAESRRRLDDYLRDRESLEPNLADAVVGLAARVGDGALYDRYRAVVSAARTPQEQRRFLLSLASFRTPGEVRRTLDAILTPDVPTQDVAFLVIRLFSNPVGREDAWRFLRRRWSTLRKRIPPLMISRMVDATPALRTPRHAREVREFFRSHPVPEAARALRQASERFRLNAELRRRTAKGLAGWLARRGV